MFALYISIIFVLSLYVIFVCIKNYIFLTQDENYEISDTYNSYATFKNTMRALYKYYLKRFSKILKFFLHYLEFIFIKIVNYIVSIFDRVYKRLINRFLEKSVENKSYVKFFWKDLKEFKKEIDSDR